MRPGANTGDLVLGHYLRQIRRSARGAVGPWAVDYIWWMVSRRDWAGVQALGRHLGWLGHALDRRHRRTAAANVSKAFGAAAATMDVPAIVRGTFTNTVLLALESMWYMQAPLEARLEVCRLEGEEHLQAALARGNGAVLATGHLGNWEVGAQRVQAGGYALHPLSRASSNRRLAAKTHEIRRRAGVEVIPISEGIRGILRALRHNALVPIMPDRNAKGHGITVPFFGQPSHVWPTPGLIASRSGAPILPAFTTRQPDGALCVRVQPPLEVSETGGRDEGLRESTVRFMALLEAEVRAYPDQYAWTYELWRPESRPESVGAGEDVAFA